ncbi:hypothetical protein [Profundibacter amoris]|uniref:Lipoprotein n=1 Tax=Profundibacter amoris TaxID=2171755 RepID=A0A347UEU2_9RHOB|nr:hypothetical protein [Profundibacter amoris]AXX97370.1 hypothetical protein BAR1_05150 [Profundibacter amoris]
MIQIGNISFVTKAVALCGMAFTAGCAPADESHVTQKQKDRFIAAMISAGCLVNSEEAAVKVEKQTGFSEEKLTAIVLELKETGEVVRESDSLKLINEGCP